MDEELKKLISKYRSYQESLLKNLKEIKKNEGEKSLSYQKDNSYLLIWKTVIKDLSEILDKNEHEGKSKKV